MKTTHLTTVTLSLGTLLLFFQNCAPQHSAVELNSGQSPPAESSGPILESAVADLLTTRCSSCHSGAPSPGDPVGDVLDVNQLVGLGHLVPGDPASSNLYVVLVDGSMPPGNPFTIEERDLVFQWIEGLE